MADTTRVTGGVRNDGLAQVSADQVTILGNGTAENPLRLGAGGVTFVADGQQGGHFGKVQVGETVVVTAAPPTVGIASLRAASSGVSGGPSSELAQAVGIVVVDGPGDASVVQFSGLVTLPAAIWDSVTGGSGGLTPGATYYLSNIVGQLTTTAPTSSGSFVVQVGDALDATTLVLSLPAFPLFNP